MHNHILPTDSTNVRAQGFLFIHRKTFKTRPKALDVTKYRLKRSKWFTPRTALMLEKYALTEEELVSIQRIFSRTDFKVNATYIGCQTKPEMAFEAKIKRCFRDSPMYCSAWSIISKHRTVIYFSLRLRKIRTSS